jgi:hypothetical protein
VLLESLSLTYELTYFFTKRTRRLATLSNGLLAFRQFNKVFSGRGRVAFEKGRPGRHARGAPLHRIDNGGSNPNLVSITRSAERGNHCREEDSEVSILLYNIARLYEGIDANLSSGISFRDDSTGERPGAPR